jgi:ABC-type nickel/cobalt efflux system permease component RcnA
MRLVCEYEARLASPIAAGATIAFEDRSFAERIGWREIVVLGDGLAIGGDGTGTDGEGVSRRLTSYPADLLTQPLDMRSIAVTATPGGSALAPWSAPDAQPLTAAPAPAAPVGGPATAGSIGAVPGGVADDLAGLIDIDDLTPLAILGSLAIAFGLGVVHALSPGHGKTIMAAYLVGTKGSSRQAVGLGLAVTVSHTLGVLVLAGITLAASSVLPPERLYPILGVASGALVIAIGASLLWARLRAIGLLPARSDRGHDHDHDHDHGVGHARFDGHAHSHPHPHPQRHAHVHPHVARQRHVDEAGTSPGEAPASDGVSWRGLVALGLSGGLVPSASALILLLGSIAAGRVAYGVVLVLGFGAGMAVVLAGIGLLIVNARRLLDRRPSMARLQRLAMPIQLATASLVVALGVVLTGQALTQVL